MMRWGEDIEAPGEGAHHEHRVVDAGHQPLLRRQPAADLLGAEDVEAVLQPQAHLVVANTGSQLAAMQQQVGQSLQAATQSLAQLSQAARDRLYRQVTGTVRWDESMQALAGAGLQHAIEVGPGRVLTGLLKRIAPTITRYNVAEPVHLNELAPLREAQR